MEIKYSKIANSLKASEIREILKLSEMPQIISFAGGMPASETFPIKELAKISKKVIEEDGNIALQYTATEGYTPLRETIAKERMTKLGVKTSAEEILIISGSQQGLDLIGRLLIDENDTVICENPSYLGALNAFRLNNPNLIGIPMDKDGMIIEELEKVLATDKTVKLIYTIPDFQNPTGVTMSLERRKRLAELATKYKVIVAEDSPYGELNFNKRTLPSIKSFDRDGYVIFIGTFSKILCPGNRIAWMCAKKEILEKLTQMKQAVDLQSSTLSQRIIYFYINKYDIEAHIENINTLYLKRRDVMINAIESFFPKDVGITRPSGGLFIWVELKQEIDTAELLKKALTLNVAFVPGKAFFVDADKRNFLRLNYSSMNELKIEEGIKRISKLLTKYYN